MRTIFLFVVGSLLFVVACTPEEEDIPCLSTFDCPAGMECSPEGVCVEAIGGSDTSSPLDDHVFPKDDVSLAGDDSMEQDDVTVTDAQGDGTGSSEDEDASDEDEIFPLDEEESFPDEENEVISDDTTIYPDEEEDALTEDDLSQPEEEPVFDEGVEVTEVDLAIGDDLLVADGDAAFDEPPDLVDESVVEDDSVPDYDVTEYTKTIGTDTFTNTVPWSPNYAYRYSAAIYPKAQVSTVPITITRLAWNSSTSGTSSVTANIKILLKETSDTVIPSQIAYTTVKDGAVEVFSGTLTGTQGWNEKVLDTPFAYSGTKNLMVITELTVASPGALRYWYLSGTSSNTTHSWYGSSDPAAGNGINNEGLPNIRLTYY